jgi:hypothetical protein
MANNITGGKSISPQQMIAQWRTLPNKFDVNIWNFEVKAGKAAVSIFKESFNLRKFNSANALIPWQRRKKTRSYPILEETGSLKNSIKWKHLSKVSEGASGVQIYTDPNGFKNTKRHRGFCYAAVHNAPDGSYAYGNTGVPSVQRQFIGHSTVLESKLRELSYIIFEGFPK